MIIMHIGGPLGDPHISIEIENLTTESTFKIYWRGELERDKTYDSCEEALGCLFACLKVMLYGKAD